MNSFEKNIRIKARTEAEAEQIARAMSEVSGSFKAGEWQAIAKKLQNKMVQTRIRILIQ